MWLFYILIINMLISAVVLSFIVKGRRFALVYLIYNIGIFTFMSMFRSVEVGTDSDDYAMFFYRVLNVSDLSHFNHRYELGYVYLNKLLGTISSNHQILFIVTSIFIFLVVGRFIYKYSSMAWLSVIIFFGLRYFDVSISGIRQMLAIAVILLAYDYIVKKKPVIFTLLVLLAISFHNAAIIFLLAYPLSKYRLTKKSTSIIMIVSIILFVFLDKVLNKVLVYFPQYTSYVVEVEEQFSLVTIMGLLVMVSVLLVGEICHRVGSYSSNSTREIYSNTLKNREDQMQSIFILLACAIMLLALQVDIFQRFRNIFGIFAVVYLPNALNKIPNKWIKVIVIMYTVLLFLYHITVIQILRPEWQNSYPFSFFWN